MGRRRSVRPDPPLSPFGALSRVGFGETGEYGGLPGYDAALQAMSGLMAVNGPPDIDACRIGIPIVDTCTGMYGCMGILLALLERNRSGRGQQVEVTLYDTAIAMLHPHVANYAERRARQPHRQWPPEYRAV